MVYFTIVMKSEVPFNDFVQMFYLLHDLRCQFVLLLESNDVVI